MAALGEMRNRLLIVLAVMAALDVAAVVYLVAPWGEDSGKRQDEIHQLDNQRRTKTLEVAPLRDIDRKLVRAKTDIQQFYDERLPYRYSAVAEQLGKLAAASGARLADVRYRSERTELPELEALHVDAGVTGDYEQVARFINAIERDRVFFIVDGVTLGELQGGKVRLQVTMETYLRATPGRS